MRSISIRDDLDQIVLQYVRAVPEIFMSYDIAHVELVDYHEDGKLAAYDIVFVESDSLEVVLGDVSVGTDLMLEFGLYPE